MEAENDPMEGETQEEESTASSTENRNGIPSIFETKSMFGIWPMEKDNAFIILTDNSEKSAAGLVEALI